jgi:hypothetical protein
MEPFKHLKLYFDVESLLFLTYYNFFYNEMNLNIFLVYSFILMMSVVQSPKITL